MRASAIAALACAAWLAPRVAAATDAQCAPAYENAQLLRQRGKLVDARAAALTCARVACPEIARKDCAAWVLEIERATPTVTVIARDAGSSADARVRVLVDGAPRAEASAGRSFALDPGAHVFRVEREGDPPIEETITVVQGERDRALRFDLRPRAPSTPATVPAPIGAASPIAASDEVRRSVTYVPAAIATGALALSLGAAAWLGIAGRSDLSHLRTSCAPACSDADVEPVRAKLLASDVVLAAGLVSAGVAFYLWVRPPVTAGPVHTAIDLAPLRDGGVLTLRRAF